MYVVKLLLLLLSVPPLPPLYNECTHLAIRIYSYPFPTACVILMYVCTHACMLTIFSKPTSTRPQNAVFFSVKMWEDRPAKHNKQNPYTNSLPSPACFSLLSQKKKNYPPPPPFLYDNRDRRYNRWNSLESTTWENRIVVIHHVLHSYIIEQMCVLLYLKNCLKISMYGRHKYHQQRV